jgi:hypothetical protein
MGPRRVAVVALVALSVVDAGCGSRGASFDRGELGGLVLQPADLPGYSRFDEGAQVRSDMHPGPRSDPTRFDRVSGWKARFRSVDEKAARPLVVESRVDLFGSSGGARDDLDAYKQELETAPPGSGATASMLHTPKLGEQAVLARLKQGATVFFSVAWRRANATASVTTSGLVGRTGPADALALARRQDAHLLRALREQRAAQGIRAAGPSPPRAFHRRSP